MEKEKTKRIIALLVALELAVPSSAYSLDRLGVRRSVVSEELQADLSRADQELVLRTIQKMGRSELRRRIVENLLLVIRSGDHPQQLSGLFRAQIFLETVAQHKPDVLKEVQTELTQKASAYTIIGNSRPLVLEGLESLLTSGKITTSASRAEVRSFGEFSLDEIQRAGDISVAQFLRERNIDPTKFEVRLHEKKGAGYMVVSLTDLEKIKVGRYEFIYVVHPLKRYGDESGTEVSKPIHPFLIAVYEQIKKAQDAIESRHSLKKGALDEKIKAFLRPANVYKKWITTRKPLSNGERPTFFISRVADEAKNPFDGRPQRSQGGLRIVDHGMLVPEFYDHVPQNANLENQNRTIETWFTELATALMTDMGFKNIKLAMDKDRRVRGGKGVFALVQWQGNRLATVEAPTNEDKAVIMRDIALAFAQDNVINELTNAGAPDVNPWKDQVPTSQLMAWMMDETFKYLATQQPTHDLWTKRAPGLLEELKKISTDVPVTETPYLDKVVDYVNQTGSSISELSRYTGKPSDKGGVAYREFATGRGVTKGVKHLLRILIEKGQIQVEKGKIQESMERPLEGRKVAIVGAGNAALYAALHAIEEGAQVVAISDSRGAIQKEGGFSEDDIKNKIKPIKDGKAAQKSVVFAADSGAGQYRIDGATILDRGDNGTQRLLELNVDVIITAGVENQINENNANRIKALVVADAANGGTTPGASRILHEKRKYVLHSITASVGGVAISIEGEAKVNWGEPKRTDEELDKWLDQLIEETVKQDWSTFEEYQNAGITDVDLPTASHIWRLQELIPTLKTPAAEVRSEVRRAEEVRSLREEILRAPADQIPVSVRAAERVIPIQYPHQQSSIAQFLTESGIRPEDIRGQTVQLTTPDRLIQITVPEEVEPFQFLADQLETRGVQSIAEVAEVRILGGAEVGQARIPSLPEEVKQGIQRVVAEAIAVYQKSAEGALARQIAAAQGISSPTGILLDPELLLRDGYLVFALALREFFGDAVTIVVPTNNPAAVSVLNEVNKALAEQRKGPLMVSRTVDSAVETLTQQFKVKELKAIVSLNSTIADQIRRQIPDPQIITEGKLQNLFSEHQALADLARQLQNFFAIAQSA